jgi:hypothetical protein
MITETGDLIAATRVVITDAGRRGQGRRMATRPAARQPTFLNPKSTLSRRRQIQKAALDFSPKAAIRLVG